MRNPANKLDLLGARFGRLKCIQYIWVDESQASKWVCVCDCGRQKTVRTSDLRSGRTRSCGCLHREGLARMLTKHGMSGTRIHRIWRSMKDRCENPCSRDYNNYGGRGIYVCERWRDFAKFYHDMGDRPIGLSLDRIDNNGPYAPENCRWATRSEQRINSRPKSIKPNRNAYGQFS